VHKGKEFIPPGIITPKGELIYLNFQVTSTEKIIEQTFSLEDNIRHYDINYECNKDSMLSLGRACDALMKSIYYRMKKILRDHGEY